MKKTIIITLFVLLGLLFTACSNDLIDSTLDKAICEEFKIKKITEKIFLETTKLNLSEGRIYGINGIELFTNLTDLDISLNSIFDASPLNKLTQLQNLSLSDIHLPNIEKLINLESITLYGNVPYKLDLTKFNKLKTVYLKGRARRKNNSLIVPEGCKIIR